MDKRKSSVRTHALIYLSGLTISAFGSLASAATLPVLLFGAGISTAFIGVLIGSLRFNAFAVNMFFGQIGDRFSPRKIMIFCEIGAALGSMLIWTSWLQFGKENLVMFFLANNFRVFFTALQAGSVQKYGKLFDDKLAWNGRMAVWMNGATNGILLLAGVLSILFFKRLSIELVVAVDFVTFLINGALLFFLQPPDTSSEVSKTQPKGVSGLNVLRYYRHLPLLFTLDVILSIVLCGSNTLNVRLLEAAPNLVPLMPAVFGGAAFVTTLVGVKFRPNAPGLWIVLSLSMVAQGLLAHFPWAVLGISVIRNLAYWSIFQSISKEFMRATPSENYAAASAGRTSVTVAVLASGEFWVGLTKYIPIAYEMGWRSAVALVAIATRKKRIVYEV